MEVAGNGQTDLPRVETKNETMLAEAAPLRQDYGDAFLILDVAGDREPVRRSEASLRLISAH
jgi:hypothetical protein